MEDPFKIGDRAFIADLKACTLSPAEFTHEAHLRLAWIWIARYGVARATCDVPDIIQTYVRHLGAEDKYNETLTVAAVKMVYHFTLKSQPNDFKGFVKEYPRLKVNFKDLLASHYSFDIFSSPVAKRVYLEPDLMAFDGCIST